MIHEMELYSRDMRALEVARGAWMSLSERRKVRERCKAFAYGRQWGDMVRDTDGALLSEQDKVIKEGRTPVTNNIIRQLVKSIVGRYRYMCTPAEEGEQGTMPTAASLQRSTLAVSETDARALEEFLISGMAIQRHSAGGEWENVSPRCFFHHPFSRPDGSDCTMMGMLHDMTMAEAFKAFGPLSTRIARGLKQALERGRGAGSPWAGAGLPGSFESAERPDTYRIVELWQKQGYEYLHITDPVSGCSRRGSVDELERIEGLNRARAEVGSEPLSCEYKVCEQWRCTWLTPAGEVLYRQGPEAELRPPFVLRFFPLIDGEVHSLVEDVIDQQKYVNRLISLLDHIISSSAKGVLLYPADQLPEGFTWRDLRRIWANPNGILPFKRTAKGMMPQQVTASGAVGSGATEMLKVQLQLFEQISGASGAMAGRSSSATGEGMLRTELENALVSMLDVLASFRGFVLERDKMWGKGESSLR